MGIISIVLFAISLLISFIPNTLSYIAFVPAIAGLVLGIISLVKKKGKAKSIVGIVLNSIILLIVFAGFIYTISNYETLETAQDVAQDNSVLCVTWEDFYRLEEKDNGINITAIGIVNSVDFEELSDNKEYYRTRIELKIFDKDVYPHYITVMYNRPYNSTKILEDDTVWVYGTYQYPLLINANNIEISR